MLHLLVKLSQSFCTALHVNEVDRSCLGALFDPKTKADALATLKKIRTITTSLDLNIYSDEVINAIIELVNAIVPLEQLRDSFIKYFSVEGNVEAEAIMQGILKQLIESDEKSASAT